MGASSIRRIRPWAKQREPVAVERATGLTKGIALGGGKYDIACGRIDIGNALTELSARAATGVKQVNGARAPEAMIGVQHVGDADILFGVTQKAV